MSEEGYEYIIRDENDPVIFTVFPDNARVIEKFHQMTHDNEPGIKICYGVNLRTKRVVWMGSTDEILLPSGQCIKDRCSVKIEYVIYVDSYELLNHGEPFDVSLLCPAYLEEKADDILQFFNIAHAAAAERLYDEFIYQFNKFNKAGKEGKLTLRHSSGSIENEKKKEVW